MRFVICLVDVVADAGFLKPLAQVLGERLPVRMCLLPAAEEELDLDAELKRGLLLFHGAVVVSLCVRERRCCYYFDECVTETQTDRWSL